MSVQRRIRPIQSPVNSAIRRDLGPLPSGNSSYRPSETHCTARRGGSRAGNVEGAPRSASDLFSPANAHTGGRHTLLPVTREMPVRPQNINGRMHRMTLSPHTKRKASWRRVPSKQKFQRLCGLPGCEQPGDSPQWGNPTVPLPRSARRRTQFCVQGPVRRTLPQNGIQRIALSGRKISSETDFI